MELDLVEHEPTVLEYARFYGLCRDYTQQRALIDNITPPSTEAFLSDLQDPKDAPAATNLAEQLTKERLAVTKEAAMLLKSVHFLHEAPPDFQLIPDGRRRILSLKQEVPLLRTDNELDLLEFGSAVEPSSTDLRLPFDPVNEENDEGLEWPKKYFAYPAQCDERAKGEKLAISKEVLLYLQDAIRDSLTSEDTVKIKEEGMSYGKNIATRPFTPPLLPLSPPMSPYIPSSPGNRLELLSEDQDSAAGEAKELEGRIMNADALVRLDSNNSDPMLLDMMETNDYDYKLEDVKSPSTKRKATDLRIEGPLTPLMFSESPAKKLKTVAFAEMLVEYIPELPSNYESGNDILSPEDNYAFFQEIIEPHADRANWRVENEKLSEADTTKRVDVPQVDFRLPTAPWDEFKRNSIGNVAGETDVDAQGRFLSEVKRKYMRLVTSWHGVSELDRRLPLAPFSHHAAKATIEEKLHGEEVLIKTLAELTMGDIATSSTDIWKRDGLRILEDEKQEEDILEPADLEERNDIDVLIRKKKLEMQDVVGDQKNHRSAITSMPADIGQSPYMRGKVHGSHHWGNGTPVIHEETKSLKVHKELLPMPARSKARQQSHNDRDKNLMFGGKFSATSALDNFMALHGMSVKPQKAAGKEQAAPNRPSAPPLPSPIRPTEQARADPPGPPNTSMQPDGSSKVAQPLPDLPALPENLPPCSFIISSRLLQQRGISRQIESLYPNAEFVSRDFESPYAASKEADLLLSPSTGLIIATLQQLKQRALPGQPDRSPVKERMMTLQYRYERLVVTITEGLSREREEHGSGRPLDHRDQEAITEYEDFALEMGGEVLVRYVRGGEQALARSIVGDMGRFGLPHGSRDIGDIKPLSDETNWEVFLRRAGLNTFAAQVILALVKDPVDYPLLPYQTSDMISVYGLQTFLMMSAEQRVQSFQAVLGGSRILRRVNTLLDQEWVSAAHGFRM